MKKFVKGGVAAVAISGIVALGIYIFKKKKAKKAEEVVKEPEQEQEEDGDDEESE